MEERLSGTLLPGVADPAKDYLVIQLELPKDLLGIESSIEVGFNLSDFGNSAATAHEMGSRIDNGTTETRTYYLNPSLSDTPALFWRLRFDL